MFRVILVSLLLASCAAPSATLVDIDPDSVIVHSYGDDLALVNAEAKKGCALAGKEAVPISHVCDGGYCRYKRWLYACK